MPDKDKAVAYAERLGRERGTNAVGWWSQNHLGGGCDTRRNVEVKYEARALLKGIEDGDLMLLDSIPHPDLSGEFADTLTGPQLVQDAWRAAGVEIDDPDGPAVTTDSVIYDDEICDAYEAAFSRAVEAEVVRLAKAALR